MAIIEKYLQLSLWAFRGKGQWICKYLTIIKMHLKNYQKLKMNNVTKAVVAFEQKFH